MALQPAAVSFVRPTTAPLLVRLSRLLSAVVRTLWGLTAAVLFLLAFPLALLLAPLLWAGGKFWGRSEEDF
ncbi:MAG: hypothetical protein J2P50_06725 [Hyphomicrobiaceae bacterium]|nr:hypothetical protein [Hyphomicrobiaceae bacterium]